MNCWYCNCPLDIVPNGTYHFRKWLPAGLPCPPLEDKERAAHAECQAEHWHNVSIGLTYLDQPLNDCVYFVRDSKTMYGWYERDGKRYPERVWAALDCYQLPKVFRAWLESNGFWPDWWAGRRLEVYRDTERAKMRLLASTY